MTEPAPVCLLVAVALLCLRVPYLARALVVVGLAYLLVLACAKVVAMTEEGE